MTYVIERLSEMVVKELKKQHIIVDLATYSIIRDITKRIVSSIGNTDTIVFKSLDTKHYVELISQETLLILHLYEKSINRGS